MRDSLKQHIAELKETTAAKERIESELNIAHDIQMSMLPINFPNLSRFEVNAILKPAKEVGGDLYDFFFLNDDTFCFTIGDVSGKGVPAALFMALTKTLIKSSSHLNISPEDIIKKVNKELVFQNSKMLFVTLFFAIIDLKTGKVQFVNAGHNPPVIKSKNCQYLDIKPNIPLGIDDSFSFEGDEFNLSPGEEILLYTDGVTEAQNENQELYSEEKLLIECSQCCHDDASSILNDIFDSVVRFTNTAPQFDDITLLALKYKGNVN